ncbi:MAG: ABC transporter substrate-binding protein [Comamonadaceae bacterium]|nr:ABC transporter substrate-binding protein [Comamonadaceae bacterium]
MALPVGSRHHRDLEQCVCAGQAAGLLRRRHAPRASTPACGTARVPAASTSQIFNGLVGFERGTTRLQAELASAWQIAPDARTFTFTLRRGMKFHATPYFTPTREFNADDVIFTFARMTDPQHPFHRAFPATYVPRRAWGWRR